jgi:predicted DNA-binding transcriptional regulator AlpA
MQHQSTLPPLMNCPDTCTFFGGSKPINPATLYRNIKAGRYPRPVKIGPGTSRWFRSECEAALRAMAERRTER